jgi:hypothetical protein
MSIRFYLAVLMLATCPLATRVHSFSQARSNADATPNAPSEVTVLAHELRYENRLVTTRGGPVNRLVRMATMKVRNNSNRKIAGVSWYFVVLKNREEEYFRLPYTTISEIETDKSKTLRGFFWVPRTAQTQTITVDDLAQPPKFQSLVVVSCILFSDGATVALNEGFKPDCNRLLKAKNR